MSQTTRVGALRLSALLIASLLVRPALAAEVQVAAPEVLGVTNSTPILVAHAEGAQLYECKPDASGVTMWTFREPIATLISGGKTIGRHYAGPTWALDDGSAVKGRLLASTPGASSSDVPLLKLSVAEHHGVGILNGVNLILRLNTHGGNLKGACATPGETRAQPYSADYDFLP